MVEIWAELGEDILERGYARLTSRSAQVSHSTGDFQPRDVILKQECGHLRLSLSCDVRIATTDIVSR